MNRLHTYNRDSLLAMPVAGNDGLRNLVRREANAGNLAISGTAIVGMGRDECVGALMGDAVPQAAPFALSGAIAPTPTRASTAPDAGALLAQAVAMLTANKVENLDEARVRELAHDETVKAMGNGAFPEDRVQTLINEALSKARVMNRLEIVIGEAPAREVSGARHCQYLQVLRWLVAGVPLWLWGGAGAGKTTMARQLAEALGVPCYVVSIDPTATVGKLVGFRNLATGDFVPGALFAPYRDGGLVLLDEIDTGDAGIIASLNALLANDHYLFPNGDTIARHEKFVVMAGANTKGTGATGWFKARVALDGATLDRFAVVELKYDGGLEMHLCTGEANTSTEWQGADYSEARKRDLSKVWVQWVQKVREAVGSSLLVSPRASINGCKAVRCGVPIAEIAEALVFKLASEDTKKAIVARCGNPASL